MTSSGEHRSENLGTTARMVRPATMIACLLAALALAGCGNDRPEVSLRAQLSGETREVRFPRAGLAVELPRELDTRPAEAPQVFRAAYGKALVSAYAYERAEQVPLDDQQLRAALTRLEAEAEQRTPSYVLRSSGTAQVAGGRALELIGDQMISGQRLRTHSLHVFIEGAEYVIELLAPRREFLRFDRALFPLVERTLAVTGAIRAEGGS